MQRPSGHNYFKRTNIAMAPQPMKQ